MKRHMSLILKGPKKSAQRAGARRGVHMSSCHQTGGDVQCYAPCKPGTDAAVDTWFNADNRLARRGKRAKPGALLYTGPFCSSAQLGGVRRRKRRK